MALVIRDLKFLESLFSILDLARFTDISESMFSEGDMADTRSSRLGF